MVLIEHFPKLRQVYEYDCGACVLQSMLIYNGFDSSDIMASRIIKMAKTDKNGTEPKNILRVFKKMKLEAGIITDMSLNDIKGFLDEGLPVILLLQAWSKKPRDYSNEWRYGHYAVVIGYDKRRFYFEDPALIDRAYLSYKELAERWHGRGIYDGQKYNNLGIVVLKRRKSTISMNHMD